MSNLVSTLSSTMNDTILTTVDYVLHASLMPLIIIFGVLGNISNIYIFTRPVLHRTCSIYFLAGAINGLVLLLFGTTTRWLGHTFPELDGTRHSLFFCRFRNYVMTIIYDLAPYFIACVTIDRFCSSSSNVAIRRLSTRPQIAYIIIIMIVLVSFIAFIHVPIFYSITDSICQTEPGFYTQFFPFFTTVYYFTPVILIITFGLGTIHNVRAQARRIQPMLSRRRGRNDSQLLLMLLVHVGCYALFAMPYHITLIVAAVDPSVLTRRRFLFAQHVTIIALNFSQAIDCYVYTFTASLYRKELMGLLRKIFRRHRIEPIPVLAMSVRPTTLRT